MHSSNQVRLNSAFFLRVTAKDMMLHFKTNIRQTVLAVGFCLYVVQKQVMQSTMLEIKMVASDWWHREGTRNSSQNIVMCCFHCWLHECVHFGKTQQVVQWAFPYLSACPLYIKRNFSWSPLSNQVYNLSNLPFSLNTYTSQHTPLCTLNIQYTHTSHILTTHYKHICTCTHTHTTQTHAPYIPSTHSTPPHISSAWS